MYGWNRHRSRMFTSACQTVALLVAVGLPTLHAASAQEALRTQPSQKEKQKLAAQIASEGLNCPVVGVVDDAGTDVGGVEQCGVREYVAVPFSAGAHREPLANASHHVGTARLARRAGKPEPVGRRRRRQDAGCACFVHPLEQLE